ncbi:uncharacterized protein LOC119301741 [Triticum dicoccoides]|uniref:uncharacterized protein LOC119301741 n=1 Tax=Triticum dicoccoides TaxID=85692 RepID=UPI00188FD5E7|nr:uncharacterized protein LOC119301741 [Triticum dicoccoides]XP_037434620.1 uncharacterized protein LOC119301741 [Triticum dicoccoides]
MSIWNLLPLVGALVFYPYECVILLVVFCVVRSGEKVFDFHWIFEMGRLWKVSHKDVPVVSSFSSAYSLDEPFVPNDFAEDDSYPMSPELSEDDGNFDRALFEFYMNHELRRSFCDLL